MADSTDSTDSTDSSSGFSIADAIKTATDVVNAGAGAYKTISGSPATAVAAAKPGTAATAATTALQKYLPYILGGVALLVVGFFVFRKK